MTSTGRTLHCTNVYKLVGKELATQFDCGLQVAKFQHFLLSKICRSNTTKECPPRLLNPFFLKEAYTKKKKNYALPSWTCIKSVFFFSFYLSESGCSTPTAAVVLCPWLLHYLRRWHRPLGPCRHHPSSHHLLHKELPCLVHFPFFHVSLEVAGAKGRT